MTKLPEGTVSFLFTDIEGSTRLLSRHPSDYAHALLRHDEIMRAAIASYGVIFETIGDAVYAAFDTPTEAIRAALDAQLGLSSESWGERRSQ
ncbi:MAG: hypothetical protein M3R54_08675 [Chloroflexota bacterium]|nr:hypothetical protein [Chloroflexota bacterium]